MLTRLTITEWPETEVATSFDFDLLAVENRDDLFGHRRRIHDGAVHDRVLRQRLQAEAHQLVAVFRLLQLDGFHRTRADVQAD